MIINGTIDSNYNLSGSVSSSSSIDGTLNSSRDISGTLMETVLKGLSAYEVAVKDGFTGTESEWLQSLIGKDVQVEVISDTDTEYILKFISGSKVIITPNLHGVQGLQGEQGLQGIQGEKGDTGDSGVYVGTGDMPDGYNVQIDPSGEALDLEEYIAQEVNKYIISGISPASKNTLGGIIVGDNLDITSTGVLSVSTSTEVDEDNTKPITSAAVYKEIGNIAALLETI